MLRGNVGFVMNDHEGALRDFDRAAALDPSSFANQYNRASALGRLKRHAEAVEPATRAIELQPSNPQGPHLRAMLYGELGKYDQALRDFIDTFRLDDSMKTLQSIGQTYQKLSADPGAMERFASDFKLGAGGTAARIVRARYYLANGNYRAAIDDLNQAIRVNPRSARAYSLRAEANRA